MDGYEENGINMEESPILIKCHGCERNIKRNKDNNECLIYLENDSSRDQHNENGVKDVISSKTQPTNFEVNETRDENQLSHDHNNDFYLDQYFEMDDYEEIQSVSDIRCNCERYQQKDKAKLANHVTEFGFYNKRRFKCSNN
ncbi:hypothetical protein RhiirB3_389892 [Rhizophagus irregularis]|nr:hypothetical protein RhiirB3_389892 [Rhizophagus irregularis]